MKLVTLISTLLLTMTASAQDFTQARVETLSSVEINGEPTPYSGRLVLNYVEDRLQVEIYRDPCGQLKANRQGLFRCMAAVELITEFSAPLIEKTKACGSLVYRGFEDQTPVDGLKTSIEVLDHSTRLCRDLVPSKLVVKAETESIRTNVKTTYLLMK